mgnify:CR=1 FL=1
MELMIALVVGLLLGGGVLGSVLGLALNARIRDLKTQMASRESELMAERLQAAGVDARLKLYPDIGHVRILMALRFPGLAPVLDDTMDFIGERRIRPAR